MDDRNYGNMLLIWDRIFGTFTYGNPADIRYGLDVADDKRSDELATKWASVPPRRQVECSTLEASLCAPLVRTLRHAIARNQNLQEV